MKPFFLLISTGLIFSCSTPKKNTTVPAKDQSTTILPVKQIDKQGHRGCRGLMPENTIPAMTYALGSGVTTLEMDVVITKDKQVILSHEPFFSHEISTTLNGSFITQEEEKTFNIYEMTFTETQNIDVGSKVHPRFPKQQKMVVYKPRLADVFDSVKQYMLTAKRPFPFFNIETKSNPITDKSYHPAPAEFVELLMKVIKEKGMEDYTIIQSFDFRTLQYLHQHYPSIKTAMLIEGSDKASFEDQLKKLGFTATIYSPNYALVTPELIASCHANKMQVIPWTVNNKKEIDRLKALGVDGIITDYPNLFNE